jgi:hypothetical protein
MLLWTRVSLGTLFAATAIAATGIAWHNQRDRSARPPVTVQVAPPASEIPQPQVVEPDHPTPDEPPESRAAVAGEIDQTAWLPHGYVQTLSPDDAANLVAFVNAWVRDYGEAPAIEYRKGVVFAESREDRGDDGPRPRSAEPEGERVCGTQALWLRNVLHRTIWDISDMVSLTCSQNICWYGGSEWTPSGYLVFQRYKTVDDEQTWALDAWIQLYDAGLPPKTVHHNENDILEIIDRLPKSCKGEPAGAY